MQILMISFDHTITGQGSGITAGDTHERHIKYVSALRQHYPEGQITVIVKAPVSTSFQRLRLSDGLTVYPVPCQRWAFALKAKQVLKALLNEEHFDLVTTQTPFDDGWLGVWLKRRFRIPLNVQMRSSFLDLSYWIKERPIIYRAFNALGKWVADRADTIRVVSYGEKQRLGNMFPELQGKILTLPPFVNFQTFSEPLQLSEKEQIHNIIQQHGMNRSPFLLFVGRLVLQKNLPILLQAFASVRRNGQEVVLVIAGDGGLREHLEGLAKQLHVDSNILWLGNMSLKTLRGWYALARGTILPSFHEGFGKVIVESYLMGTPVIATPFVSAEELIQNGETGFVLQSFTDPDELAEKMLHVLESTDLAKDMGKRGRAHMANYLFSEDVYMERLIEIWRKTICAE